MKLSLVMATVGRCEEVGQMIRSLAAQDTRAFELIVVDQNADDRLEREISNGLAAGVDIRHERLFPPDQGAARNLGIRLARHEVIGFPDDDCWYEPGVVSGVLEAFSAGQCDGVIVRWHEEDPRGEAPPHLLSEDRWRSFREVNASMIAQFFRRGLLVELSGFDLRLGLSRWYGGAEETDLIFRALRQGYRFQYCPTLLVHHPCPTEVRADRLMQECRRSRRRARGTGAIYAKHRLSPYVILRGFLAPLLKPLLPPTSLAVVAVGVFVCLGRVEGFLRWRLREH